jgi:hypothetical protein
MVEHEGDRRIAVDQLGQLAQLVLADAGVERLVGLGQCSDACGEPSPGHEPWLFVLDVAPHADYERPAGQRRDCCRAILQWSLRHHGPDDWPPQCQRLDPRHLGQRVVGPATRLDDD